jgi:hypothetical protein
MSQSAIAANNRVRADRETFVVGVAGLRTQMLESIGPDGKSLLRHPETGHADVTPADIWEQMLLQHGVIRSVDIRNKYNQLSFIPPGMFLASFIVNYKETHAFLELHNQKLNQITKITEFNSAIAHDRQLTRLQYQYTTVEQPDLNLQTFDDLSSTARSITTLSSTTTAPATQIVQPHQQRTHRRRSANPMKSFWPCKNSIKAFNYCSIPINALNSTVSKRTWQISEH